jgi:hypothetical protein
MRRSAAAPTHHLPIDKTNLIQSYPNGAQPVMPSLRGMTSPLDSNFHIGAPLLRIGREKMSAVWMSEIVSKLPPANTNERGK